MNNPPAFPHVADIVQVDGNAAFVKTLTQNGMTLRDYFAAKAMQGMVSEPSLRATPEEFASESYKMADAMLVAREKA